MKTKVEWEVAIAEITNTIGQEFPELSKYIDEMPENNSEQGEINAKNLEDYYNSLDEMVHNYATTHKGKISKKGRKDEI